MKQILLVLLCLTAIQISRAQTFAEWFEQNKTQKRYYLKQIAALEVYIAQARKGYAILESGLQTIRQLKSGEFNLHTAFYQSLESINPVIGNMGEVLEIVALQAAIVNRFTNSLARIRKQETGGTSRLDYIGKVYSLVLSSGLVDINSLLDILTPGKLQLSDGERMERIRVLDMSMKDRYVFTASFTNQADLTSRQAEADRAELGTLREFYGLP